MIDNITNPTSVSENNSADVNNPPILEDITNPTSAVNVHDVISQRPILHGIRTRPTMLSVIRQIGWSGTAVLLKRATEGETVALTISAVDRGRGDPWNILGVIVQHDQMNDKYRTGVKSGLLKVFYSRNDFELCPQSLLSIRDVNSNTKLSLRTAVISESNYRGQGIHKCNSGLNQCKNNLCKCLKPKLKCNSRCHGSLSYSNK